MSIPKVGDSNADVLFFDVNESESRNPFSFPNFLNTLKK